MSVRRLILALTVAFPLFATAQEKGKVHYNIGMKAGFQAVTYNDPEFDIEGYRFDTNNIQSNKIGYAISLFARVAKSITKITAKPIPQASLVFLETPRKGQIPRN